MNKPIDDRLFTAYTNGQTFNGKLGLAYHSLRYDQHISQRDLLCDFYASIDHCAPEVIQHLVAGDFEKAGEAMSKAYLITLEDR